MSKDDSGPMCRTCYGNNWVCGDCQERERARLTGCIERLEHDLAAAQTREADRAAERDRLREALKTIRDDYDCDSDAHKYDTICRKCLAADALADGGDECSD